MNPLDVVSQIRPLVLAVSHDGTIEQAIGGLGGFLGHEPEDLVDHNVFEYVDASDADELMTYFLESSPDVIETQSLPLPFRVHVIGSDGAVHLVDVMASRRRVVSPDEPWIVTLVPLRLQTALTRSLDGEMSGKSRAEVKRLLADELTVDDDAYRSRMFFVDMYEADGTSVTPSRVDDHEVASAIRDAIVDDGWEPWSSVANGESKPLSVDVLPGTVAEHAVQHQWRRMSVTAVRLDDEPIAAFLFFGRAPDGFPVDVVLSNISVRLERLVATTALIMTRWRERDRLMVAATSDPLTGLVNRTELIAAQRGRPAGYGSAYMYIDIDDFKAINDRFGHAVGDIVLVEVADRVVGVCRTIDTVSRFGGDEFVVLLEDVDDVAAEAIGNRVIDAMSQPLEIPDGPASVSVSVGIGHDVEAADRAMLSAKRSGRARLEIDLAPATDD